MRGVRLMGQGEEALGKAKLGCRWWACKCAAAGWDGERGPGKMGGWRRRAQTRTHWYVIDVTCLKSTAYLEKCRGPEHVYWSLYVLADEQDSLPPSTSRACAQAHGLSALSLVSSSASLASLTAASSFSGSPRPPPDAARFSCCPLARRAAEATGRRSPARAGAIDGSCG
jgi:hypothetical protein